MSGTPAHILIIDDEEIIREALHALLTRDGCVVKSAATAGEGLAMLEDEDFDTVLLDLMLPDRNGLDVLEEIRRADEDLPVVMITAFGTIDTAVRATKQGAFHYFTKPFKNDEVLVVLRNAIERRRLQRENLELRNRLKSGSHRFDQIIGGSARMKAVYDLIGRAAPSRTTVLIQGESGTGKELVAQACHRRSARADKAFVTVNSGNLPPDLLESNLFGHVKGAFTGAVAMKKGLFELADRGTIFFDEIGNERLRRGKTPTDRRNLFQQKNANFKTDFFFERARNGSNAAQTEERGNRTGGNRAFPECRNARARVSAVLRRARHLGEEKNFAQKFGKKL